MLLDDACHRAGPHRFVVAVLNQPVAGLVGEFDRHVAICELGFELHDELVDDLRDDFDRQMAEGHDGVETIAEFRREKLVDRLDVLALALAAMEAE